MGDRSSGRACALGVWALACIGAFGCSSDPIAPSDAGVATDRGGTDAPAADAPAAGPSVRVSMPAAGAMFPVGGATNITVAATNFTLEDFPHTGHESVAGHGHFHVYLDAYDGNDYLIADYRTTVPIVIPPGTTAGAHALRISLRNHDHSPLTAGPVPTATDFVLPITVTAQNGPSVSILSPPDNAMVTAGGALMFRIAAMNFGFQAPSATNQDGRGHFAVYLDDASGSDRLTMESTATMFSATVPAGTSPGPHRVRVSLRQNDETPVAGFPEATLRILVGN